MMEEREEAKGGRLEAGMVRWREGEGKWVGNSGHTQRMLRALAPMKRQINYKKHN